MEVYLDTNILVRLLTEDDEEQTRQVKAILSRVEFARLSWTVLLELEWVLRSSYSLQREDIATAFEALVGHDSVVVDAENLVKQALAAFRKGMDMGDALHLFSCRERVPLVTFDRAFIKKSEASGLQGQVKHPTDFLR